MIGGGVYTSSAPLTVENSTIANNRASEFGGGITSYSPLSVIASTITGNIADSDADASGNGGGIYANSTTPLDRTILAGNTDRGGETDACFVETFDGTITSLGHNLFDDLTGCTLTPDSTDLVGVDPLLGPLADNGGPTPTRALLATSPAIDAAGACTLGADQRGVTRPQGTACDIGAYEFACGNGTVDLGETCDDGNSADGDCCSSACRLEEDGSPCSDGNACTASDTCTDGACTSGAPPIATRAKAASRRRAASRHRASTATNQRRAFTARSA